MNYRLVANQVSDLLKYDTTINVIDRAAQSVFKFHKEPFPNEAITSSRAKSVHDWVLSLAKQPLSSEDRNSQLSQFLSIITPDNLEGKVDKILKTAAITSSLGSHIAEDFSNRKLHEKINLHCRNLFLQENYFHAVFEAAKVYNKYVQEKSQSSKDGTPLMHDVLSGNGTLKLNTGRTDTEKNIQEGVQFLSAGLMQALRNPTAHEPAIDWPISRQDCLDMLSFISYLFRQIDNAVYFYKS